MKEKGRSVSQIKLFMAFRRMLKRLLELAPPSRSPPVSYTHLDVYKRQGGAAFQSIIAQQDKRPVIVVVPVPGGLAFILPKKRAIQDAANFQAFPRKSHLNIGIG